MIFDSRKKATENDKSSKYANVTLYEKPAEIDHELDLVLVIYNAIADQNQSVDWTGFSYFCDLYDVEDIKTFTEYILIIKTIINNFDKIFDDKTNTPEIRKLNEYMEKRKREKMKK